MGHRTLRECVVDLERAGRLIRSEEPIDPHLEAAEIQRRLYASQGPAVLFTRAVGCRFPLLANLFGTLERARFLFRDTYESVRRLIELKIDPGSALKRPGRYWKTPLAAIAMAPRTVRHGGVLQNEIGIADLPKIVSWPMDGGAFITLPQVYTEDCRAPGFDRSNLGMYRVQLSGGQYEPGREIGLHYQIHRGIGVHHAAALAAGQPLRVNIFVGGSPAMTLAAVMPLPEGLSELRFAGALAGHRIPMIRRRSELPIYANADFCISGVVDSAKTLPEGPFGDHLGYYSLKHDFPVLRVDRVFAREGAIWPFTVVGRPPQEDTTFGQLIHELTGPVIPTVIPGVQAVHAVDAAGVHPLLLAIGSERYWPYSRANRPQELLTQASAILGQGQMSLAKYLLIVAGEDDPALDVHDIAAFFTHLLRRVDWRRDLHFQTETTIDTLDYSGDAINVGSKVVIAASGPPKRTLPTAPPGSVPSPFRDPGVCIHGIAVFGGPPYGDRSQGEAQMRRLAEDLAGRGDWKEWPLIVVVDDSQFATRSLANFLWTVFTRSNPAADLYGVEEFIDRKHWGCRGSLLIDARAKPHHAPPLVEDPAISRKVDALAARGGPLARYL